MLAIMDQDEIWVEASADEALYELKEDEDYVQSLPELDKENLILESCAQSGLKRHDDA